MNKLLSDEEEIALMECPECGKQMKLCIFKGEDIRNTFCTKCNKSVIWKKIGE